MSGYEQEEGVVTSSSQALKRRKEYRDRACDCNLGICSIWPIVFGQAATSMSGRLAIDLESIPSTSTFLLATIPQGAVPSRFLRLISRPTWSSHSFFP